MTRMT